MFVKVFVFSLICIQLFLKKKLDYPHSKHYCILDNRLKNCRLLNFHYLTHHPTEKQMLMFKKN
jgi:hypothetical protein